MTPVEFKFVLPTGEPMANATVDIKLGRASHTGSLTGITMPRPITVQTDAAGKAVLSLWPSATAYFVEVLDAASEAGIFYKFLVPEVAPGVTVRLQDLVVDAPMSGVFYDDAALLAIHNSKVNARASELAAKDWAALAASKAQDMTSFVVATTANKDAAALSEFNANAKAVEAAASAAAALGSKNAAATSEANALASKNAAAGSATTAATKATEAASSATAADASKTAAGTSATNAANSATAAQASKDSAQTSATTATTKATEASSSATAAASSAATASTKATEAGNSANAAATSASQAAASAAAAAAAGVSSFNTRTGAVSLTQADVFAALGYTPYNATNPNGYITAAGNVATATKLATARTINGVPFDGSANITITDDTKLSLLATAAAAAKLGTARTLTIGATGKSFDGSANVAWSLAEIGALPLAGGALTGDLATAGRVSLPNDAVTPGAHTGAARFGRFDREAGSAVLQLGGADNVRSFELIDRDWTTVILGASMSAFTYKGNAVWHSGNLNPANYAPLTNPSLPGTFEVYGEAYIRSSFHVLNAAQNGWHTVINRNGGNPSVNAPGGISAPNAVLNRGWLPQGTDFNAVRAPGFYGVEMGSWSGLLLDLGGVGGSTPRMQFWATYGDELYFRAARDADTQFDGIGYAQNRIWHSGNFDAARPSFSRVTCGFDSGADQSINCSNWFRSSGNSGWYNQTYGGGINMEDGTFVRVSHGKHFLCPERVFGNGAGQGLGAITVSTAGPSGGRTGDIWIQY